jgi:hypothetical protein
MSTNDMRYHCSLLRRHNWFAHTPYGYTLTHKYFITDTIDHIKKWIKYGKYRYWDTDKYRKE